MDMANTLFMLLVIFSSLSSSLCTCVSIKKNYYCCVVPLCALFSVTFSSFADSSFFLTQSLGAVGVTLEVWLGLRLGWRAGGVETTTDVTF